MDILYPQCAGIDVHKRTVVVAVGYVDEQGHSRKQTQTYSTMTDDLQRLAEWLMEKGVTHVAMESTGVYWKSVFNLLEGHFAVILANAQHVKAVPGRKTDVRDAEWLLDLAQHGLIRGSFIPPADIRELREFTRHRRSLIEERTREVNRVQKLLEDANIKLASVATDVMGVSVRNMLQAIIDGVDDPLQIADLARRRLRRKLPDLQQALHGRVLSHHRLLLRQLIEHIDFLDRQIEELTKEVEQRTRPFEVERGLLCSIPGVGPRVFEVIMAELGADMSHFPSARHLCSWAALCPGNYESAGKRLRGGRRYGNSWLTAVLLQAAWAATHVPGYLRAQFQHIAKRRGEKRAAIAVAHSLLAIIYEILTKRTSYQDLGADYFHRMDADKRKQYLLRQLAELGYDAKLEPHAA
jgi:transposase